ncbi:hypothetical protein AWV80_05575 [Cupriavidus sp. UYMU48A]|nr:hypothetical protein AWV80_05575 [Cupriavidus sp. UYMU48A]
MSNLPISVLFGIQQAIFGMEVRYFNFNLKDPIMSNFKKAVFGALMAITLLGTAVAAPVAPPPGTGECFYDVERQVWVCE